MSRKAYVCWLELDRLLKTMQWRGFAYADSKEWFGEEILRAQELAVVGDWDACLALLQNASDLYHAEWLKVKASEYKRAA